jgi:hypothetical protein
VISPEVGDSSFSPFGRKGGPDTGVDSSVVPEAALVEGHLFGEQVIDGPAQLGGQDAQSLALTAFLLLTL